MDCGESAMRLEAPVLLIREPPAARRDEGPPVARALFAAAAACVLVAAAVLPALTVRTGHFVGSEVPVYTEAVDGWGCHLLGNCQEPGTAQSGTGPARLLYGVSGQGVLVECVLGGFYKLSEPVSGWVPRHSVHTTADPLGCYAGEF